MATSYPGALDSFTNPTTSDRQSSPSHSTQHANINDAMEAVQALLGATGAHFPGGITIKPSSAVTAFTYDQNFNAKTVVIDTECTTSIGQEILADTLTSGQAQYMRSDSASFAGQLAVFRVGNGGATGIPVVIENLGTGVGFSINQDGNAAALVIDSEVSNDGLIIDVAPAGTSPQNWSLYRNDDVTGNMIMRLGAGYIWVDATGDLRIKSSQPTSDTDGTIVGTQS